MAEIFIGLLVAVSVLGLLAKRIGVPYPILLVIGGLLIALIPGLPQIRIEPDLIFIFFLPPLLFPAALFTSWRDFRRNLRPILLLAVGLVIFTTVAVGYLAHYFMGMPLAAGFALGAIISPPDAIAATAIAERLSVPRRIVAVLEGESLVNDATALVTYRFAVAAVVTGGFSLSQASAQFFIVSLGGIALGLLIGGLAAMFHCRVDDTPVEITASLITPYAAYVLAERLHVSGVLAVVTAGLFLGWRAPQLLTSSTRLQAGPFWNMVEFLLNGFVFMLIGFKLPEAIRLLNGRPFGQVAGYAFGISLAIILIRIVWVFPATYIPRFLFKSIRDRDPYPRWQHVAIVGWTGMRGVLSLAAALALPLTVMKGSPFPDRDLILFLTVVVIVVTLVLQGLSLPLLIRWLGIEDDGSQEKEEQRARIEANRAALAHLETSAAAHPELAEAIHRLELEYKDRLHHLETPYENGEHNGLYSSDYEKLAGEALKIERDTILELRNRSVINDEVLRRIQRDIDLAEARLSEGE